MRSSVVAASVAALATFGLIAGTGGAQAHVTLETQAAPVAVDLQGRVPRAARLQGCRHDRDPRAHPRRRDRGQADAQARLDPRDRQGKYGKSYDYYGTPVTEGVKEVVWSGGSCRTRSTTSSSCAFI